MKLIDVMNQIEFSDIYRTFYPKTNEYTFFSEPHGMFSKTDHIINYKTSLNRYKKNEIIPCILSDQRRVNTNIIVIPISIPYNRNRSNTT